MGFKLNDLAINIIEGYEKLWARYQYPCMALSALSLGFLMVGSFNHDFGVIGIGLGMMLATTSYAWFIGRPK